MGRGSTFGQTAIAIATVSLLSTNSNAQESGLGTPFVASLDLSTRVESDSNAGLDTVSAGTTFEASQSLNFAISSETRVQKLSFNTGTTLKFVDSPGGGTSSDLSDPTLRLSYSREGANSDVSAALSYRESDVNDAISAEDSTVDDVTVDTGKLEVTTASVSLNFANNAPFRYSFSAAMTDRNYSDTTDPDLFDKSTETLSASAFFRISPVTEASAKVSRTATSSENPEQTEKETVSYSLGMSHEFRQGLTLNGELGYRTVDTTEFPLFTTTEGTFGSLDIEQEVGNGKIFGGVDFDASDGDESVSLTFGRDIDLPDGSLSASLTIFNSDDDGTQYLGSLDYSRDMPTGALTVGLTQSISTDEDDEDSKFSKLGLGYSQELNSVSRVGLALDLSQSQDIGTGASETKSRANLTATYSRSLTKDWDLSVGYKHRRYDVTGSDTAVSDSIFMTLSRNIAFGF